MMKVVNYIIILLFLSMHSFAQVINKVEYFIDADPGFGNGTDVPVTAAANISDLLVAVNINSLSVGFHNVYLRSKNDAGTWSLSNRWTFVKAVAAVNVDKLEYFTDTDPGLGNGINVSITPGSNVTNITIPVDLTALSTGFHTIYLRSKDDAGAWSITNRWMFVKAVAAVNVNKLEYFTDTDPGFGNATNITITAGSNVVNVAIPVDLTALSNGFHTIYLRSKDDAGAWSITNRWTFVKDNLAINTNKIEYFIDTDPGFGSATDVTVTPGNNITNLAIPVDISALSKGFHTIYLRSKDDAGSWSLTNRWMFVKDLAPANVNKAEYFVDTDPGFGNATDVPVTAGSNISNVSIPIDISALNMGVHNIYLRTKDINGAWSLTNRWLFFKDIARDNFQGGEYFFDTDPGFGNGTAIPFGGGLGTNISDFSFAANISGLPNGLHYLFIRTKELNGKWSLTNVIQFDKQIPLPITLLYFTARADGKKSLLNWETATEINNDRFEIERSSDAVTFNKIGQVAGAGNSNTHITYQWYDDNPLKGNNYYRLKQVDIDGKFSYSPTRQVNFKDKNYFTLLNNPSNGVPLIVNTTALNSTISIFDETGRKLKELPVNSNTVFISVDQFPNAVYVLVMHAGGAIKATEKFVVNR